MMIQALVNGADGGDRPSLPHPNDRFDPNSEPLRVMLIGSADGITATIHNLHQRGFAAVGEWSPLVPVGQGELMSVLTKRLRRGGHG
jgi:hypothetical protein